MAPPGDSCWNSASKASFVKLTFNFLVGENLFVEVNKRYYPTERFQAIVEHYFEEYRGQIYDSLSNMTFEKEQM